MHSSDRDRARQNFLREINEVALSMSNDQITQGKIFVIANDAYAEAEQALGSFPVDYQVWISAPRDQVWICEPKSIQRIIETDDLHANKFLGVKRDGAIVSMTYEQWSAGHSDRFTIKVRK